MKCSVLERLKKLSLIYIALLCHRMAVGDTVDFYPLNITPEIHFSAKIPQKRGIDLCKSVKVKATAEVKVI